MLSLTAVTVYGSAIAVRIRREPSVHGMRPCIALTLSRMSTSPFTQGKTTAFSQIASTPLSANGFRLPSTSLVTYSGLREFSSIGSCLAWAAQGLWRGDHSDACVARGLVRQADRQEEVDVGFEQGKNIILYHLRDTECGQGVERMLTWSQTPC